VRRLFLVAGHEYQRFFRRRSFLFSLIGMPVFLILIMGVGELSRVGSGEAETIGYVDRAGVLEPRVLGTGAAEDLRPEELLAFDTEEAGLEALADGQVAGLVVVPQDYLRERSLLAYYDEGEPGEEVWSAFRDFIRASLLSAENPQVAERVGEGAELTVQSLQGDREMAPGGFMDVLLPFAAGFIFIFAAITSGGYLLQTVSDEKENRTVEVLTTSESTNQLIFGKALGLIALAATQLLVWGLGVVAAIVIAAQFFEPLAAAEVPWVLLGVVVAFFIPSYLLVAGIMITIGSAFPEYKQSQQVVAIINILFFIPFFLVTILFENPNGTLAVALSLFPTTAFLTIAMRWGAAVIPLWQLLSAWAILTTTAGLSIWVAPKVFRAGMLRYGQRLDLGESWRALRGGR